ncbi:MAG: hypothetical protein K2X77_07090 [Candidatus Obscuribacterales bacterium]|jgi:hypothetical protein|nr:hypothetical protein [Candidatus Obscuribacterales bacterium]
MAPGVNNQPNDSEQPRPERREDAFEAQQQRADQNSRVDVSQNVEQYTADSKKNFQKPKEENSSGISKFGFTPTAKINPEESPSTEVNKMQSAAEHFEHMATQEKLEKEQLRDAEFRAKFGDPAHLQGNISETRLPTEMLAALPQQERSVAEQAARPQELASAEVRPPMDSSTHRDSQQSVVKDNSAIEDNALRFLRSGSLYSDGPPPRPEAAQSQEPTKLAQMMPLKIEAQEKERAGKILTGEFHGFVDTTIGALIAMGDLLRIGAAVGPLGAINIDPEGKQKLHDACSGMSNFSRIVLQYSTTLNRESPLYGKNFDPEGRQMAINFATSLPLKFKAELEQFKSAPLEEQSRKATELVLNLGLLAGGIGEVSKLGSVARTAEEAAAFSQAGRLASESKIAGKLTSDIRDFADKLKGISSNKLDDLVRTLDEKWPRIELGPKQVSDGATLGPGGQTRQIGDYSMKMEKFSDRNKSHRGRDKSREAREEKESKTNLEANELNKIMEEGWKEIHEAKTVRYLRAKGEEITKNPKEGTYPSDAYNRRQTDGLEWELKCMSKVKESRGIKDAIYDHARDGSDKYLGKDQPGKVLIDARDQRYLTESLAEDGMRAAFLRNDKLKEIRIVGSEFDLSLAGPKGKIRRR